jgi:replication factor C subunit 3/5
MGVEETKTVGNLPWVEKYRPNSLDQLISHQDIIQTIQRFMKENRFPHLLFYGPPGTGKTSTILACAKQMYSPKELGSMVLELNASDDRGIGIVRGVILNFAGTKTLFNSGFKLVILDEADAMTNDAQNALRRIIEKYTENVRFCIICNYLSKIIPALQSRCTRFRFGPLQTAQIMPRLEHIVEKEGVSVTPDGKKALIDLAEGDMRRVINLLQSTSMAFEEVNETNVYLCCGHPLKSDIGQVLEWLLNDKYTDIYKNILKLQEDKGLALQDLITQIHLFVHKINFPIDIKVTILEKMANVELQLASGGSERLQLAALVSAFEPARRYSEDAQASEDPKSKSKAKK